MTTVQTIKTTGGNSSNKNQKELLADAPARAAGMKHAAECLQMQAPQDLLQTFQADVYHWKRGAKRG